MFKKKRNFSQLTSQMKWISTYQSAWTRLLSSLPKKHYSVVDQCNLCLAPTSDIPMLCHHCHDDLVKFNMEMCQNNLLNWPAIAKLIKKPKFDQLLSLSPYQWPVSQWLTELKYHQRFDYAKLIAALMAQFIKTRCRHEDDAAWLCVPISAATWRNRGYNQAHIIAREFCQSLQVNYLKSALNKSRDTLSQVGQTGTQRRRNLRGKFSLNPAVTLPERVYLFDDVITTGATANEISKLLKQNGVKYITLVTVAISLPHTQ